MKLLGIDYGDSRIGIAVSDDLGMFAHPLIVLKNRGIKNNLEDIINIIQERKIEKIIIGFPLNMNGTQGERCQKTEEFVAELEKIFQGEIIKWDERLTTVAADRMLLEYDLSRKKRKQVVDKIAACYILQGYLDKLKK